MPWSRLLVRMHIEDVLKEYIFVQLPFTATLLEDMSDVMITICICSCFCSIATCIGIGTNLKVGGLKPYKVNL